MKRFPLRSQGSSPVAQIKRRIQALIREIAVIRDGGCVLRGFPVAGKCGPLKSDGTLILQAEHLVSRARSVSFGDMRNIVSLCRNHHFYFKQRNGRLYWELIEKIIGPERWEYIKWVEADQRHYAMSLWDWQKIEAGLRAEVNSIHVGAA